MRWFPFFQGSYAIFMLVFTIGTCIAVMQRWLLAEQTKKEVETEKLNTELSFLKSQINPHFFFNNLNNIYSLAVTGSSQTASAVMRLSSIMRYLLSDTQSDKVPLENEINFIKNYIDLQSVRITDKVKVTLLVEGDANNLQIAPLLFIPFIENAFKYGVSAKESSDIFFKIEAKDNTVLFVGKNNIIKSENAIHETTGIGINNVKRRLELLYPDKYSLQVLQSEKTFSVQLYISLK
jgi:sensor histidine kinase YesM